MDVIRRNTDYGLRMMANLASHFNSRLMSARELADEGNFSYQLGCKVLQTLHKAGLVESCMGAKGGFRLSRAPAQITLYEIIEALQGGIRLNKCLPGGEGCEFRADCEVGTKLACLQLYMEGYLGGITLEEVLQDQSEVKKVSQKI